METTNLNFECTHETVAGTMTCSWLEGRVKLVEYFATKKTHCIVDDEVMRVFDNLTICEFMKLQCECQQEADDMIKGGAL